MIDDALTVSPQGAANDRRPATAWRGRLLMVGLAALLGGCGISDLLTKDPQEDAYKKAEVLPPLEVPPDLTLTPDDDALLVPGIDTQAANGAPVSALAGAGGGSATTQGLPPTAIGASAEQAIDAPVMVKEGRGGIPYIDVRHDFPRAWRELGIALVASKVKVEDKDRSRGLYFIEYPLAPVKKKGRLAKLKFWSSDKPKPVPLLLKIRSGGGTSQVVLLDREEKVVERPGVKAFMDKLAGEMRKLLNPDKDAGDDGDDNG